MRYFFILLGLLCTANKAEAVTATGHATVVIEKLISVTEQTQMNFGQVYSTSTAGDVTLSPAGARSSASSTQFGSTAAAGIFKVNADPNVTLTVSVAGGTLSSGANNITLDTMSYTPTTATTDSSGNVTVNVGGRITTAANQPSGTYTGTYTITVNYP